MFDWSAALELKSRVEALERNRLTQVAGALILAVVMVDVILPSSAKTAWLDLLMGFALVLCLLVAIRHRFFIIALGLLVVLAGAAISVWYTFTGTPRPPNDHITGAVLVAGLLIVAADLTFIALRLRSLRKRAEYGQQETTG